MRLTVQKLMTVGVLSLLTSFTAFSQNDLSLSVTTASSTVAIGDNVTFTITVNNQGATAVTGVQVTNVLPAGLTYSSHVAGTGSYNSGTGVWTIGNIGSGTASVSMTLTATVAAEGVSLLQSHITAMTEYDGDSDPTDDSPLEDDYSAACVTVPIQYCSGATIDVDATAPAGFTAYQWYKDGNPIGGATSQTYNITETGEFTFIVDGGTVGACDGSSCCPVIVENIPSPTAGITNNTGTTVLNCTTTSISVTATGGGTYAWSGGLGNAAAASITTPGTYTVTVTAANGCTDTESITITQDITPPTAGITNNTGSTVLTCATTAISVTATGGGTYAWSGGLGNAAGASITAPGTYTVTVTAANGCTDTEAITITQDLTPPTAGITNNTGTTVLTCTTTSISVTATGGGTYAWSGGLGNTAAASITAPGTYTVTVTAANGCTDTEAITITQDITAPTAGITNNTGTTVLTCVTTSISVTATGGGTYAWSGGLGNAAAATITTAGTYTVTVTAANGCTDTESITITGSCTVDYADLPDGTGGTGAGDYQTTQANGGPSHGIITGLSLGGVVDAEGDGQPSAGADADDNTGSDDDNGVIVGTSYDIVPGGTIRVPISVTNTTGNTAYLVAWVDWNGDGDFNDAGEQVASLNDGGGSFPAYMEITVPSTATTGSDIGVIVRLSNTNSMNPGGYYNTGEVESFLIDVNCPAQICLPVQAIKN